MYTFNEERKPLKETASGNGGILSYVGPRIKRIYEPASRGDGKRILVDRLWPRGMSKERAAVDEWIREIAPSTELRKWFGHDPSKWTEFKKKYRKELLKNRDLLRLKEEARKRTVTLLYAAKDPEHNNAAVLKEVMDE
jgi:uncharacterized protein YeaO (DUF488 family)